jgi:hypothetical protein
MSSFPNKIIESDLYEYYASPDNPGLIDDLNKMLLMLKPGIWALADGFRSECGPITHMTRGYWTGRPNQLNIWIADWRGGLERRSAFSPNEIMKIIPAGTKHEQCFRDWRKRADGTLYYGYINPLNQEGLWPDEPNKPIETIAPEEQEDIPGWWKIDVLREIKNKPIPIPEPDKNAKFGWLSPNGTLYPCETEWHDRLQYALEVRYNIEDLAKRWIRLGTNQSNRKPEWYCLYDYQHITKAQQNFIMDWCQKNEYSYPHFLKNVA